MSFVFPEQQQRQPLIPPQTENFPSRQEASRGNRGRGGHGRPYRPAPNYSISVSDTENSRRAPQSVQSSSRGQAQAPSFRSNANDYYRGRGQRPFHGRGRASQQFQSRSLQVSQTSQDVRNLISTSQSVVNPDELSRYSTNGIELRSSENANVAVRVGGGSQKKTQKIEDKNQRERLIEDLNKEKIECQFCFERIWSKQPTWSCDECFNIFHLKCVRGWASSCKRESEDSAWRCMICQFVLNDEPKLYMCFCRKKENPEWNPSLTPHSCGDVCGKGSSKGNAGQGCDHPCICLCHPGPCPPCQRLVSRTCGCGKIKAQEQCSSSSVLVCSSVCDKLLDCGNHRCTQTCHIGPCSSCSITVEKSCHCGRNVRVLSCQAASTASFSCGSICSRKLECGKHVCQKQCHLDECGPCPRDPSLVLSCPCGKHPLEVGARKSCLDAIPGCLEVCGKIMTGCGSEKTPHFCESGCHDGDCPQCNKKTAISCACRSSTQVIACQDLTAEVFNWRCGKRCQKKMICGRHKCENICCDFEEHICLKVCGKKLSCGLHNCQDPCGHPGACRRCYNTEFRERTCNCGFTVQLPPIACGAPLPPCPNPCSLNHPCGHPPTHLCHGEAQCPPCTFLCEKRCFGDHESRRNIPCHITGISCGKTCGKSLNCGVHSCRKVCHTGPCQIADGKCQQVCTLANRKCGHQCGAPCHGLNHCPATACKASVELTCECKLHKMNVPCHQHDTLIKEYLKRKDVSLKDVKIDDLRFAMPTDVLECDEECRRVERNSKMAAALNVDENNHSDSDFVSGPPVYTENLKQFCRENHRWASQIETSMIALINNLTQSRSLRRVHQFQPMHGDQRKFLHELASYYGCETQSYDDEPLRSVSLVAKIDVVRTPAIPLYQVIAAERPAKQTARCPTRSVAAVQAKEKPVQTFSWAMEMPQSQEGKGTPTYVDYFDVTD